MSQHLWQPVSWLTQEGIVDLSVTLASGADRPQMLIDVAMDWVRGGLRQVRVTVGFEMAFAAIFSTKGAEIGWLQIGVSAVHLVDLIARRLDEWKTPSAAIRSAAAAQDQ